MPRPIPPASPWKVGEGGLGQSKSLNSAPEGRLRDTIQGDGAPKGPPSGTPPAEAGPRIELARLDPPPQLRKSPLVGISRVLVRVPVSGAGVCAGGCPLWDFSRVLVCMPVFGSRVRVWRCQLWGMQTLSRHCVRGVYWALLRCVDSWFPPSFHCPCCASPGVRSSPGVVRGMRARAGHLGSGHPPPYHGLARGCLLRPGKPPPQFLLRESGKPGSSPYRLPALP